ncbi:MAG: HEAT repeat domain-containing protein [Candidatus Wallbacteria bacterium]|nr:HEAT repeat domain-containing protein [Candidatus Wallbacteria bacterium]
MPLTARTLPFMLLTFLQEAVVLLAMSTAEGLFLKRVGSQFLPGLYLLSAVISACSSLLYAVVRSRWDNRRLALGTLVGFGGAVLAVSAPLERNVRAAFYLYFTIVAIFVMIVRIQLWLVINRRFTTREAKRVFPLLTGAGLAGSILAGLLLQVFPAAWGPAQYQRVTAAFTFLYLAVFFLGAREARTAGPQESVPAAKPSATAILGQMREAATSPYLRNLALLVLSQIAILTLVDYQFNRVCDARFPEESALIGFFGMFRSVTNMGAFLSQMFLTHRVISALGVGLSLLVTPLASIGYGAALAAVFGFHAGVAAKLVGRFLQRTLHGSLYQVLFNAVDERGRDAAMLVCDGIAYSIGTVSASALLWCVVRLGPAAINLVILIAAVLFLIVSLGLRRAYLALLVYHFRGGQSHVQEGLAQLAGAPGAAQVRKGSLAALARLGTRAALPYLLQGLEDSSPDVRIEAVRGLAALGDETVLPELVARLDREQDDRVRSQLLRAFGRFQGSHVVDGLLGFLHDRVPRIRADLIEILGSFSDRRHAPQVLVALEDREVRVRANAVLALWRIGDDEQVRSALTALRRMLASKDAAARSGGAFVLGRIGNRMASRLLVAMLERQEDPRVLKNVVLGLARTGGEGLADPLLVSFERAAPEARPVWLAALKRTGRENPEPFVRAALTGSHAVRILAIEMLGMTKSERALDALLELSKDPEAEVRVSALRSLTRFSDPRVDTRLREVMQFDLDERVRATAQRRVGGPRARRLFPQLLRALEAPTDREKANTLEALTGLASRLLSGDAELAALSGQRPSASADEPSPGRDFVAKFLDAAAALLAHSSGRVSANAAYGLWKLGDPRGAAALVAMLSEERVKSALHCIGKTGDAQFAGPVSALLTSPDETLRTRAAAVLERIGAQWDEILDKLGAAADRSLVDLLAAYSAGGERTRTYLRRALKEGRGSLVSGLADKDPRVRLQVLEVMQVLGEKLDRPEALAMLELPSEEMRCRAAALLARVDWKEPPEAFHRFWLAEIERVYRYVWCASLLTRVAPVHLPSLMELAEAVAARAREAAMALVATFDVFDPQKSFRSIAQGLGDSDQVSRARALEALENLVPGELARPLLPVLETEVRTWGELASRHFADPARQPSLDAVFGLVRDEDPRVREAAGDALLDLSDRYVTELLEREAPGRIGARALALAENIQRKAPRREEGRPDAA